MSLLVPELLGAGPALTLLGLVPRTVPDTHAFAELKARAFQPTHLAGLETRTPVSQEVLSESPRLRAIALFVMVATAFWTRQRWLAGRPAWPGAASQPRPGPRRTCGPLRTNVERVPFHFNFKYTNNTPLFPLKNQNMPYKLK